MNKIKVILTYISFMMPMVINSAQNFDKPKETLPVEMIYFFGSVVGNSVAIRRKIMCIMIRP